jgi:NAD(P)-dependent dehydrogenase (short-subunit alcohol dehydrogenase family)
VSEFGRIDILVNNAAHQASFREIEDITDEEWDLTFKVNIYAMFYLTKATARGREQLAHAVLAAAHEDRGTPKVSRMLLWQ